MSNLSILDMEVLGTVKNSSGTEQQILSQMFATTPQELRKSLARLVSRGLIEQRGDTYFARTD